MSLLETSVDKPSPDDFSPLISSHHLPASTEALAEANELINFLTEPTDPCVLRFADGIDIFNSYLEEASSAYVSDESRLVQANDPLYAARVTVRGILANILFEHGEASVYTVENEAIRRLNPKRSSREAAMNLIINEMEKIHQQLQTPGQKTYYCSTITWGEFEAKREGYDPNADLPREKAESFE